MSTCPVCQHELNGAATLSGDGDAVPEPGDYSICVYCTSYLEFDDQLNYKVIEVEDIVNMDNETLFALTATRNKINKMKAEPEPNSIFEFFGLE